MTALSSGEQYWRDHQPWLLSLGYHVRPRFRQDWIPSWVTLPVKDILELNYREDYITHRGVAPIMDAIRLSDNKPVMLKKIYSRDANVNHEQFISEFVSTPEQRQDPDNCCVPCLDVLRIPEDDEHVIIVMPLLRGWRTPRFDTIGEAVDMIRQAFKGIQYLHRNHIAHRDCAVLNFMMDGSEMYPDGFHPVRHDRNREFTGSAFQKYTRTQRPPRYHWIDFGLSVLFDPSEKFPRAMPTHGGDKSVPEHQHIYRTRSPQEPTNPFPTDIYYLGNMLRMFFTEGSPDQFYRRKYGFDFLKPLVDTMVQEDPEKRPNIDECVVHLEEIIGSLSSWTLRSQVWHATDNPFGFVCRFFPHWARRVVYIITRTPAIPNRKSKQPSIRLPLYTNILLAIWIIVAIFTLYLFISAGT